MKSLSSLIHLKTLDLSSLSLTTFEEATHLSHFLQNSSSLEDIKMPKLALENEPENNMAAYDLLKALV